MARKFWKFVHGWKGLTLIFCKNDRSLQLFLIELQQNKTKFENNETIAGKCSLLLTKLQR